MKNLLPLTLLLSGCAFSSQLGSPSTDAAVAQIATQLNPALKAQADAIQSIAKYLDEVVKLNKLKVPEEAKK